LKPDVVVIHKRSAWERYWAQNGQSIPFASYVHKLGTSGEELMEAHKAHVAARDRVVEWLQKRGLSVEVFHLDSLNESVYNYYKMGSLTQKEKSGICPKLGCVISVGGDGTLLHASHYVGGKTCLLGVNSNPEGSYGHLCATTVENFSVWLDAFFSQNLAKAPHCSARRLLVETSQKDDLPLALNDVLFCHKHPGASSRYTLTIGGPQGGQEQQQSSGLWVSTPIGSTAVVATYGFQPSHPESSNILVAVREAFLPLPNSRQWEQFQICDANHSLEVMSRMRQGLVCVDGPDHEAPLGFGETLSLSLPEGAQLRLAWKPPH